MTIEMITAKMELKELVDVFSNLADVKDAKSQGDLFTPDGVLEFQRGFDGEVQNIVGREALVEAFAATIGPCKAVYHINGQHDVTMSDDLTQAEGVAYCEATLVREEKGKNVLTTNYVRYADKYVKVDGRWYISRRRTTFLISDSHEVTA